LKTGKKKLKFNERSKDLLLIFGLAIVIFAMAQLVFRGNKNTELTFHENEIEQRVSNLLEEIEGVGSAEVMICETEEGVKSVVVVCDGAKDLQVLLNVREAVGSALGIQQNAVKIYLKKE
jgi:hypothetical protein